MAAGCRCAHRRYLRLLLPHHTVPIVPFYYPPIPIRWKYRSCTSFTGISCPVYRRKASALLLQQHTDSRNHLASGFLCIPLTVWFLSDCIQYQKPPVPAAAYSHPESRTLVIHRFHAYLCGVAEQIRVRQFPAQHFRILQIKDLCLALGTCSGSCAPVSSPFAKRGEDFRARITIFFCTAQGGCNLNRRYLRRRFRQ